MGINLVQVIGFLVGVGLTLGALFFFVLPSAPCSMSGLGMAEPISRLGILIAAILFGAGVTWFLTKE